MTKNIRVIRTANKTNRSSDGKTFDVIFANADDGRSYTIYSTTPGHELIKEGAEVCLTYKTNVANGKTYYNCTSVQPKSDNPTVPLNQQVLESINHIANLLEQLLKIKTGGTKYVTRSAPIQTETYNINNPSITSNASNSSNPHPAEVSEEDLFGNDGKNDELPF